MRASHWFAIAIPFLLCSAPASAAPPEGTPSLELVYKPIAPCRAFDTRSATPIPTGGVREFFISGTALSSQGGSRTGCGVPTYATAVQLTLSTTNAVSAGYALAYGATSDRPTVVGTAFTGSALASASSVTPVGLVAGNRKIRVYATKQTNVIGDVTGYYAPQIAAMIRSTGGIYSGTPRVLNAVRTTTGSYTVTIDRDVSNCTPSAQAYTYGNDAHASLFDGKTARVYVFERDAGKTEPRDDFVYLSIVC